MSPEDETRVRQLIREILDERDATPRPFGNRGRDTMQVIAEHAAKTVGPAVIAKQAVGPARGNPHHIVERRGQN